MDQQRGSRGRVEFDTEGGEGRVGGVILGAASLLFVGFGLAVACTGGEADVHNEDPLDPVETACIVGERECPCAEGNSCNRPGLVCEGGTCECADDRCGDDPVGMPDDESGESSESGDESDDESGDESTG